MHEVSLVRNIFRTLTEESTSEELRRLTDIYLKVGLLSNVEPVLMQSAFRAVVETEYPDQDLTLHIDVLPILVHCRHCDALTEIRNYRFVCRCGQPSSNIVQGNELLISKVVFSDS
jgi:hydrogenase nickel incorporation protein HypA/HybF